MGMLTTGSNHCQVQSIQIPDLFLVSYVPFFIKNNNNNVLHNVCFTTTQHSPVIWIVNSLYVILYFLKNTLFQIIPDCFPSPLQSRTIWLRTDSRGNPSPPPSSLRQIKYSLPGFECFLCDWHFWFFSFNYGIRQLTMLVNLIGLGSG